MVVLAELVTELKTLRKGRGLLASRIDERIGPALREVCAVMDKDQSAQIRQKVAMKLESLADGLPADLRVAVLAAFAIPSDARLPLYQDRVGWAATRLGRDPRTARRRIDEGIHQLAQIATVSTTTVASLCGVGSTGWHTKELRVTVVLDRELPEAMEHRLIVADKNDLAEIDLAMTVTTSRTDPRPLGPNVEVFYGGTLSGHRMESSERFGFVLRLPRPLARGETHDYELHFRLPDGQAMLPHFACIPKHPCDVFDLRVRFDRTNPPAQIWLLRNVFQRDVDDPVAGGELLAMDEAGEIHVRFENLAPGLAYGARWAS